MKYKLLAVFMGLFLSAFMILQPAVAKDAYGPVKAGDNLWGIASSMRPDDSVSIQQVMLAIRDKNPQAFFNGNINSLEIGFKLYPPKLSDIQVRTRKQAVQQVLTENREWKKLGRFASAAQVLPTATDNSSKTVETTSTPSVQNLAATRAEQARLKAEIESLRQQFQQEQRRSAELEQQLQQLQLYRSKAQNLTANEQLRQQMVRLQQEIARLKQVLAEKDARIEQLEAAVKQAENAPAPVAATEVAALKTELAEAKQLLEQRDTHIQNLQSSLRKASITIKRQFTEGQAMHARLQALDPKDQTEAPQQPADPSQAQSPALTLAPVDETTTNAKASQNPPQAVFADQVDANKLPTAPIDNAEPISLKNMLQQQAVHKDKSAEDVPQPSLISLVVALVSLIFILALAWRSISQQRALRQEEKRLRAQLGRDRRLDGQGDDVRVNSAA